MNTNEFHQNFELNTKTRAGVRANPKHAPAEIVEVKTADGAAYDAGQTYYFFDVQTQEVRQSIGLRRSGEYLCTFGLRVVAVLKLRARKDDALADGQIFFKSEITRMQKRIADYELEKTTDRRSLKAFLMAKE